MGRQQAGAGAAHRAVDDREQAALAAAGEGFRKLEVAPGRGVDLHDRALAQPARPAEARQATLLGQLDIIDERAGRGHLGAPERAEGVEGLHAVERLEAAPGALAVEPAAGLGHEHALPLGEAVRELRPVEQAVGQQDLTGRETREGRRQRRGGHGLDLEVARRHVEPGQRQVALGVGDRGQVVVPAGVEQGILGEGAGGNDADHLAPDDGFRAPLPGHRRILDLLADRDPEALADEALEIGFGGVHGHAAHGDVGARVPAALGERDVEGRRRRDRVLEEQLVEIAHAKEQEAIGIGPLDLHELGDLGSGRRRAGRGRLSLRGLGHGGGRQGSALRIPGMATGRGRRWKH